MGIVEKTTNIYSKIEFEDKQIKITNYDSIIIRNKQKAANKILIILKEFLLLKIKENDLTKYIEKNKLDTEKKLKLRLVQDKKFKQQYLDYYQYLIEKNLFESSIEYDKNLKKQLPKSYEFLKNNYFTTNQEVDQFFKDLFPKTTVITFSSDALKALDSKTKLSKIYKLAKEKLLIGEFEDIL